LGKRLFFDTRLSADGTLSCASCHQPERAFSDGRPVPRGVNNAEGVRNAAALINRAYGQTFFWDGRADSLAHQALEPILNPKELALTEAQLEPKLGLKPAAITTALASFVSTIRSAGSPYDRYMQGESSALTEQEKAGLELFRGKGRCIDCHVGPNFTDEQFHNTGVAWRDNRFLDEGRAGVTHSERERGTFKTPTLREVGRTAPYMHDGSLATLEDVIEFYSQGGRPNPNLDPDIRPRRFTPEEKRALAAFLRSLSGKIEY
jgi:cytochrome c peroxidase